MLDARDVEWAQLNEFEVFQARKCDPGDFHFEKRELLSIDPITHVKTWSPIRDIYCEPVIQSIKGDEHLVVPAGLLEQGDIIATIDWLDDIDSTEPTVVGNQQYWKAVYKNEYYMIKYVHKDALGSGISRQVCLLSKTGESW